MARLSFNPGVHPRFPGVLPVRLYGSETAYFDYKVFLDAPKDMERAKKDKHNSRLREAVCAMANTDGGYLIFGVKDRAHTADDPRDRIIGIPSNDDLLRKFGDKLDGIDRPITHFTPISRAIALPNNGTSPERGVYIVYIHRSLQRPHMLSAKGTFPRRNADGTNKHMDYVQVRDLMMMENDRIRRAVLLADEVSFFGKVAASRLPVVDDPIAQMTLPRFRIAMYQILLADVSALPLSPSIKTDLVTLLKRAEAYNESLEMLIRLGFDASLPKTQEERKVYFLITNSTAAILPQIIELSKRCLSELLNITGLESHLTRKASS